MTSAETEERDHQNACLGTIQDNLRTIGARLKAYAQEIQASKTHIWEARRDMDHIEKIAIRETIDQKMRSAAVRLAACLVRALERIDFRLAFASSTPDRHRAW